MDNPVARTAIRPNQKQNVFVQGHRVDLIDEIIGIPDGMPVDFENHVAWSQARIVGRAAGAHILDGCALHALGNVELLAHVGRKIGHGQAEPAAPLVRAGVTGLFRRVFVELADRDVDRLRLAIAENAQISMGVPGAVSLTATCSARPSTIFLPLSSRSTSPLFRPARPAGESGVTWLTMAPVASGRLKKLALSGVTSFMLMPR